MRVLLTALSLVLLAVPKHAESAEPKQLKIEVKVTPGTLRFATTQFDVTAGAPVVLTFNNTCIMPHNFVLTAPGTADAVVAKAMELGADGPKKNYIPETSDILAATKVVTPGQFEILNFTAPKNPGEYPYLCSFPGHGTIMRGVMRVRPAGEKLAAAVVEKDGGPKIGDSLKDSTINPKPIGSRERPLILRSFVPNPGLADEVLANHDRGLPARPYNPNKGKDEDGKDIPAIPGIPAGIAVSFGPDFAYVWDATECRLLYAWTGGFLNMAPYWGAKTGGGRKANSYVPLIEGTLVFKAAGLHPLRLTGGKPGRPKFLGYRMVSGVPEFRYELDGKKISEHIVPADPGTFMIHSRIEHPPEPVRLVFDPSVRPQISCDQGGWNGATLELPADHGDHFMLLVRFQPGESFKPVDPATIKKEETTEEP